MQSNYIRITCIYPNNLSIEHLYLCRCAITFVLTSNNSTTPYKLDRFVDLWNFCFSFHVCEYVEWERDFWKPTNALAFVNDTMDGCRVCCSQSTYIEMSSKASDTHSRRDRNRVRVRKRRSAKAEREKNENDHWMAKEKRANRRSCWMLCAMNVSEL